ncbi:Fusaric acid cluster transcription factor FUB10 [Paramyrothecium foliicola]|nr:Fusaric acid cluster transcription factor FUB10 [Paramyrothecium foliicola]
MNSSPVAKRSACNRCREQKLRCSRSQTGENGPCDRCLRFGVYCVTGRGRPLGRPPLHGNDAGLDRSQSLAHRDRNDQSRWRRSHKRQDTSISLPSPPVSRSSASGITDSTTDKQQPFMPDTQLMEKLGLQDMQLYDPDFPGAEPSDSGTLFRDQTHLHFGQEAGELPELDFGNLDDMDSMEELTRTMDPSPNATALGTESRNQSKFSRANVDSSTDFDSSTSLAGVIGSISRQLADLKSRAWTSSPDSAGLLEGFASELSDFSGSMRLAPLENMLTITMRLVLVLQMLAPVERQGPDTTRSSASCPPTSLSTTLLLLSIYVQLGQLFDRTLKCFMRSREGTPAGSQSPSPSPTQISPGDHRMLMLVRAIEHQLHAVERLMGVSARYRIWGPRDTYPGILRQDESVLTAAAIEEAQETFYSLKQTIESTQRFLKGFHDQGRS